MHSRLLQLNERFYSLQGRTWLMKNDVASDAKPVEGVICCRPSDALEEALRVNTQLHPF